MSVLPAGTIAGVRHDASARADPVDRLEELARALLRQASSVQFAIARTEEERAAIYRLRHSVVIERGWARPEELPDGLERDEWDDGALHVAGSIAGDLIACGRLVFPAPGRPLPVEAVFDLTVEPVGQVVEFDRLVVSRAVGDRGHRVFMGLVAACWLEAHARGFHVWAGIQSRLITRLYRSLGFEVEVLGPGRRYWSEERFPVRLDAAATAGSIASVWQRALGNPDSGADFSHAVINGDRRRTDAE